MRPLLCILLSALFPCAGVCQSVPSSFLDLLKAKLLASSLQHSLSINGNATWTFSSLNESGPATFVARVDGSHESSLQLNKGKRSDQSGPLASRSCQWTDANGITHDASGGNCIVPVPWFSPLLLPSFLSTPGLLVTDGGEVTQDGATQHLLYVEPSGTVPGPDGATALKAYRVSIYYDPLTLQPTSLQYLLHPDGGRGQAIPAKVVFSDYRLTSGLEVPFRIDRYVNRSLELSISADSVSIQ